MAQVFDTPEGIAFYRGTVIASAAALYLNTGMRANRVYTPTRMRDALNEITGGKGKSLKTALTDYVNAAAKTDYPVTSPSVLKAVQS